MFELRTIGIVKRASALLLDIILLAVLTTGFMFVISLICNYGHAEELADQYYGEWEDFRTEYAGEIAEHYDGFSYEANEDDGTYTITKDGKDSSLDALMQALLEDTQRDGRMTEAYDAYQALPPANAQYLYVYSLLFMMVSLGLLLAYLVLEFILPLIFKNGQTIGKKVFGIGLVRPDCVKITNLALFARTILGKFTIEAMFPILLAFFFIFGVLGWLAIVLLAAFAILNIVLFFATRNKTPIHDMLAGTVAVDMKLQMVFESEEELIAKKSQQHKEFIETSKS